MSAKPDKAKAIKGVSGRFNPNNDINSLKTYVFVGPTSTQKEKMLSMRASLLNNSKGLKVNGMEMTSPPPKIMEKIVKA